MKKQLHQLTRRARAASRTGKTGLLALLFLCCLAGTAFAQAGGIVPVLPNVTLKSLHTSIGIPTLSSGAYALTVLPTNALIKVKAVATDPSAIITINGAPSTNVLALAVGDNQIPVLVTSADGSASATYMLIVSRPAPPSKIATLSGLGITTNNPTVLAATAGKASSYAIMVTAGITSVRVIPSFTNSGETATVNGGDPATPVTLTTSPQVIAVLVTAADGKTTKAYTLHVTTAPASDIKLAVFTLSAATALPLNIDNNTAAEKDESGTLTDPSVTSISATIATKDPDATITMADGSTLANGGTTVPVGFDPTTHIGVIQFTVTAPDGTQRLYVVSITAAPLSTNTDLAVFQVNSVDHFGYFGGYPVFSSNGTDFLTITTADPNAVITFNGIQYTQTLGVQINGFIHLDNVFQFTVTAPAGNVQNYEFYDWIFSGVNHPLPRPTVANTPVKVHPALSPDGNGINDFLQIDGIESHPENHLTVINRAGAKVFEMAGYDNQSKVFSGKTATGAKLGSGTYFYKLDYKVNGVTTTKSGYIELKN